MYTVVGYSIYLAVSILAVVWVARTLHRNGEVFLVDAFAGNQRLADSVNTLLVVGFYLVNVGYVALALKYGTKPVTLANTFEFVSTKIGLVLIVLGVMHFTNMYVFSRIRRRAELRNSPPPVAPSTWVKPARTVSGS